MIKDIFFIGLICALLGVVLSLYEHEVLGVLLNLFGLLLISISGLCYSNPKKLATEKKEEESDSISDVEESAQIQEAEDKEESDKDESDKEENTNENSDNKAPAGDGSDENLSEPKESKDSELEDDDSSQKSNENEPEDESRKAESEDSDTRPEPDEDELAKDESKNGDDDDKSLESDEDESTKDEPEDNDDDDTSPKSGEDESTKNEPEDDDDDTSSEPDEDQSAEDEEKPDPLPEKCISTTSRDKGNEQEYLLKGEYSDHEYEVEINLEGNWMSYYVDGKKRGLVSVQEQKIEIEKDFQYMKDAILSWVIVEYEYLHARYEESVALALEDEKEEALEIVKRLVSEDLPSDRELSAKDNKNYYSINLDGNARKWVCRLYFKSEKEKYAEFPGQKNKHKLKHVSDFDKYKKYQSIIVKSLKKRL